MNPAIDRRHACIAIGAWACGAASAQSQPQPAADTFPDRPVTIVSPFAAGGGTDALARAIAQQLSDAWKQPVIVENRIGAGGKIATQHLVKSRPDGYTLMITNTAVLHLLHVDANPGYRLADLQPLVRLADVPVALSASRQFTGTGFKAYVAQLKQDGATFTWGSPGAGSASHIIGTGLATQLGLRPNHVAYKGEAPMISDLVGGHVPAAISSTGAIRPFAAKGEARVLAITGQARSSMFPDAPTFRELGYPDLSMVGFNGLFAPAGLPPAVAARIIAEVTRIIASPKVREQMASQGFAECSQATPFDQQVGPESAAWGKLIAQYGIKLD